MAVGSVRAPDRPVVTGEPHYRRVGHCRDLGLARVARRREGWSGRGHAGGSIEPGTGAAGLRPPLRGERGEANPTNSGTSAAGLFAPPLPAWWGEAHAIPAGIVLGQAGPAQRFVGTDPVACCTLRVPASAPTSHTSSAHGSTAPGAAAASVEHRARRRRGVGFVTTATGAAAAAQL